MVIFRVVSQTQKFRLRSAGYKREIVAEVAEGDRYVDRESGTDFVVVGEVLPVGNTGSSLPWAEQNLRLCGCSREQLVQKDVNDCPYCDRRIPASEGDGQVSAVDPAPLAEPVSAAPTSTPEPATDAAPEVAANEPAGDAAQGDATVTEPAETTGDEPAADADGADSSDAG